jgi:hypothetical protein
MSVLVLGIAPVDAVLAQPVVDRRLVMPKVFTSWATLVPERASSITWRRVSDG